VLAEGEIDYIGFEVLGELGVDEGGEALGEGLVGRIAGKELIGCCVDGVVAPGAGKEASAGGAKVFGEGLLEVLGEGLLEGLDSFVGGEEEMGVDGEEATRAGSADLMDAESARGRRAGWRQAAGRRRRRAANH